MHSHDTFYKMLHGISSMKNAVQRYCIRIISVQHYILLLNTIFHITEDCTCMYLKD